MSSVPDTRRRAASAEIAAFYAGAASGYWDFPAFLFWENPNYTQLRWHSLTDAVIGQLPEAQRVMLTMDVVDGELSNGGLAQLFFNRIYELDVIARDVDLFGWRDFAMRFAAEYEAFVTSGKRERVAALNHAFQEKLGLGDEAGAWGEFQRAYDGVDKRLGTWFCSKKTRMTYQQEVLRFVGDHEADLIVTSDGVERLFSYGTLQQEEVQRAVFRRLLEGAPDELVGFRQEPIEITDVNVVAKSGKRFHVIAVRTGDPADRIAGTVLLVTAKEVRAADRYEVDDYKRVSVTLASGREAWAYVKR